MSLQTSLELLRQLQSGRRMLADGAVGSELIRTGIAPEQTVAANVDFPGRVREIHRRAIGAGADLLTSNTFGVPKDRSYGTEILAGAALALEAAREADREIGVMFSVYPEELRLNPALVLAPFQEPETRNFLLLIETAIDIRRAVEAVEIAKQFGVKVIAATCHFQSHGAMPDGTTPAEAVSTLQGAGASIVGANCGTGPNSMLTIAEQMRTATDLPLIFQPNDGLPEWKQDCLIYPIDIDRFAQTVAALYQRGASIVGGCCGTTPAHIAAVDRLLFHPQRRE